VLRGIRRTIGTARAGKAPATADLLMQSAKVLGWFDHPPAAQRRRLEGLREARAWA
jgi:hypothetical protein